jgi:hypothetical protein
MKKYSILFVVFIILFSTDILKAQFNRKHDSNTDSNNNESQQQTTNNNSSSTTKNNDAEEEPLKKGFDKSKIIFGGFVYPAYNYGLIIQGSAFVGYRLTKRLSAGLSSEYYYSSFSGTVYDLSGNPLGNGVQKSRAAGIGIWGKYYLLNNLLANVVLEQNNYKYSVQFPGYSDIPKPAWYQSLLVGATYRQQISNHAYMNATMLYDVLQQSPIYSNRLIYRLGFSSGF